MKPVAILACATLLASQGANAQTAIPLFAEEARQAGLRHVYTGGWEHFVGGGAASFDCNQDFRPDLFLAGGTSPAQLFVNQSDIGGALSFKKSKLADIVGVTGAYPIELNNDAHPDLVVLRIGENLLLKGGPNCSFEFANDEFGFDGGSAWTTAFTATWEANSAYPTLAFGNYIDREADGSPFGTCHDNQIVRSASPSEPQYSDDQALSPGFCTLSILFTDWRGNGARDLRITNDRQYYRDGREQLWNFSTPLAPVEYRQAEGWQDVNIWGMGIAAADVDRDGSPDFALTSMGDTKLQSLATETGHPTYVDTAFARSATAHRPYTGDDTRASTGWHAQFADLNNDGLLDLFIAKGNVSEMAEFAAFDPDNLLLGQSGGGFVEYGEQAGIALNRRGRGGVVEDFNLDGLLDILVVNRGGPASLFRSTAQQGHNFVAIKPSAGSINSHGIGATIEVSTESGTQTRTLSIGGGHASGQLGFTHFGLGTDSSGKLRVTWPNGQQSEWMDFTGNQHLTVNRQEELSVVSVR